MHILNNVIFQASVTKDHKAEEINVQKKRSQSTLRIFILLIIRQEQNISVFYYHCMRQCHIENDSVTAEGFFCKPVAYYEFVHYGPCSLNSKRDVKQQLNMALLKSQIMAETPFLILNSKCFKKLGPTHLHLSLYFSTDM